MKLPWIKTPEEKAALYVREFMGVVAEKYPGYKLESAEGTALNYTVAEGESRSFHLHNTLDRVFSQNITSKRARHRLFSDFLDSLHSFCPIEKETPFEEIRPTIMPGIRHDRFLEQVRKQLGCEAPSVPWIDGWKLAYFLDSPGAMALLTPGHLEDFGITTEECHEISMENLRREFPRETFESLFPFEGAFINLNCPNGYAAERLLLLPEYLPEDVELAALAMDSGTLILLIPPPDNNWNPLRQMASEADSKGLPRPVRVRSTGCVMM